MEPIIGGLSESAADLIKDGSTETFQDDVLNGSREAPVIVDFWAPWCGPCKTLGPALEKLVREAAGKVKLVKINVDENQALAAQFRVQSIPAVYAFADGQPVDGFVGALPESQLRQFVQRLTGDSGPSPIEQAVAQGDQLREAGDLEQAAGVYGQVLRAEPDNLPALCGLAHCYVSTGDLDRARQTLEMVPPADRGKQAVASVQAALDLAEQLGESAGGDHGELEAALAADADDHQARFDLAAALVAAGDREAAVDHLLEIVKRERAWNEEAARKQLLMLFDAFGPTDPLTVAARRRLSALLFS